jgi:hypothetical protein
MIMFAMGLGLLLLVGLLVVIVVLLLNQSQAGTPPHGKK